MRDPEELALLRSIAQDYADNTVRLALADWLQEHGDEARAEFIRVQCELANAELAADRRKALRARERALLDENRHEWVKAFGMGLEDVRFERGLIAAARPARWDSNAFLRAIQMNGLITLAELDLSGFGLKDNDLAMLSQWADLPALRKLILSNNALGRHAVQVLAKATGFPRLETLYLAGNMPAGPSRDAWETLTSSNHFRLTTLDLGTEDDIPPGYSLSHGQTEVARRTFVRTELLPFVMNLFRTYNRLQSAMLCVAQYWADEADDAVHGELVVSELPEPDLEGATGGRDDGAPDPNVPNTHIKQEYSEGGSVVYLWDLSWDENNRAIPLWAAYAPEGGSQEYDKISEAYAPAVMFYRNGGYEFLPMLRPQLDGIRPQWDDED